MSLIGAAQKLLQASEGEEEKIKDEFLAEVHKLTPVLSLVRLNWLWFLGVFLFGVGVGVLCS